MAAATDGRSSSRIKRKPPPAFPYSPKYPLPDPTDPFAPLQVLRDRAHSSQRYGGLNPSTSSLTRTPPMSTDHGRQNPQLLPELPPLPRTVVHAARSIDAIDHLRDGYHSDFSRPPRPPRSHTRPARDSTSYFSDADIASSLPTCRNHDRHQESPEKLTDRQYNHRRRSQTISFFPATPAQVSDQALAPQENRAEHQDTHLSDQYVYDDRQSHGLVYGQGNQQDRPPHTASTVDSHTHQQMSSLHTVPTPPMTPDDTLTTSSVSVHERSGSLSPEAVLQDPPSPPPPSKHATSDSDAGHAVPEVTVIPNGVVARDLARIRTSDFPSLLGKTEPDSPAPLPVPPPRPRLPARAESEPEPDFSSRRRSIIGNRRDSITRRFRRSSPYYRDRKVSDPSPPMRARKLQARDSLFEGSSQSGHTNVRREREGEAGPSHTNTHDVPQVVRASGNDGVSEPRKKAKMSHRKSLSHVSLGITPLPNVNFGPSPSPEDSRSMTNTLVAYPNSNEFDGHSPGLLPPLPPLPVHAPEPQPSPAAPPVHAPQPQPAPPQPHQPPQTLAQALELTPLPKKDSPLPPIRKDTRLPTPPREERQDWSARESHRHPSPESHRHLVREETIVHPDTVESAYTNSLPPESPPPSPEPDVVLLRPGHFNEPDYHSSPSPPLSSNSLLSRPTSAFSPIPPQVIAPLVSPSPIPPQYPAPNNNFSPLPPRSDPAPRRAPSPVGPPRRPSPVAQPPRRPSPVTQPRRAPSPLPAPRRVPSPLPPPRHTPTPPAPRRTPSPLPPRREEPPTPAPLPLSPPRRMEHDLPTPLPQPPLPPPSRVTMPVFLDELPRGFSAPRAPEPVHQQAHPPPQQAAFRSYASEAPRAFSPTQEPPRSRTPQETRQEQREQRRSEDRQERTATTYISATQSPAQTTQQGASASSAVNSRSKPPGTSYNSVRQHTTGRRGGQSQLVAQAQQTHLPFRSETPPPSHHVSARVQLHSPEHSSVPRAQSPTHLPPDRAQSPQAAAITTRGQSPVPVSRVQSPPIQTTSASTRVPAPAPPPPPPSSYTHVQTQTHRHMHSPPPSVSHEGENATMEEYGRTMASASQSTVATPQVHRLYATSVESTPLPLPNMPSTMLSDPYRSNDAGRRGRNTRGSSVPPRSGEGRGARHQHRRKEEPSAATFDEHAGLTRDQIAHAAPLTVIAQNGLRVPFGELFKERKTIVCFIRHFWCAMDQDYMHSISRNVDFEALKRAGIDFIIIGNGSHGMIKSYRHIFRTPIPMYTDPTLRLYAALGMTLRTNDPGPDSEKGDYIRHGVIGGIAMVVRNALRVGMPIWERGGDATQLGGEFVFGPGLNCSFAHRMTTTRAHAPVLDVLMAAGYHFSIPTAPDGTHSLSPEEEEAWMEERRRSLARMRARREKRRELGPVPDAGHHADEAHLYEPELGYSHGSDSDSGSVSARGSWTSSADKREAAALMAQREHDRQREMKRKPAALKRVDGGAKDRRGSKGLGLHVSNPDDRYDHYDRPDRERERDHAHQPSREHSRKHHGSTRVRVAQHDTAPEWSGGTTPTVAYINELGRREDGYETGEEGTPAYQYHRD